MIRPAAAFYNKTIYPVVTTRSSIFGGKYEIYNKRILQDLDFYTPCMCIDYGFQDACEEQNYSAWGLITEKHTPIIVMSAAASRLPDQK